MIGRNNREVEAQFVEANLLRVKAKMTDLKRVNSFWTGRIQQRQELMFECLWPALTFRLCNS